MRPTEKEFRRPPSVDTPAEPQPRRAGLRFLLAPVAGLAVFFGTVLAMSAVVAPLVELTSVGAVALTSLRAIALPTLLGAFVFTLVLGPESAWSFRLGLRLGFWFGLGTLLLNVVIDLPIDTQGPVFHAINLEGSDQWLCLALVVLPYLVIGVIGGLAAATVGRATERKRHTAQVSGVRSWQIGLGLTGAVVVLALVATLLSSSWSSAWDPLYGSGGDPEDWTDAQALVGQANAAKETGDTQGALELYARAIGTEPLFTPGWRERILVLGTERRFEEALSSAGGWIATLPGDSTAWYYKGCALEALGHHEDAIKAYEQAMSAAAQSQASGAETAATLAIRLAHCNEVLADPGLATREEYFREMATFLEGIGKVDRWVSAIVDAGTSDAAASLLSDFTSRLNESIDPALEIEPPAELETTHQELVDGLLALKRGASGMLAALQNGDSSAYSESRGTLLVGSQAIDTFERLIPNPFEG